MKNLQVVINPKVTFQENIIGQCVDADNGDLYVLSDKFQVLSTRIHSADPKVENIIIESEEEIFDKLTEPTNELRFFDFIVESGSILVAINSGYLFRIGVSSFSPKTKCIYKHHKPISSLELSPSQDLIALADEENNIYLLSIEGKILHTSNAFTEQESLHKPVGVGWGSKETQFFGLDGRLSKEEEKDNKLSLSDMEKKAIDDIEQSMNYKEFRRPQERATTIDWRGDGQYLATLTYLKDLDMHSLKVWNRNLELQYMSENLVFIERGLVTWVPNGQYVCCVQRRNKVINEIVMFEKNGLIHQRITLPNESNNLPWPIYVPYVKDLFWSFDSKILAVILKEFPSGEETLLLYTMQNSHYYLKFCSILGFPSIVGLNSSLRWDSTHPNRFHIVASQGSYCEYICSSHVTYSQDNSTVAVLDGRAVLITPLDQCNIPPPKCAISIVSPKPITNLAINYHSASNIVFGSDGIIYSTTKNGSEDDDRSAEHQIGPEINYFIAKRILNKHLNVRMHQSFFREKYGHWQHMTIIWNNLVAVSHNTEKSSSIFTYNHLAESGPSENKLGLESYVQRIGEWHGKKITYMTYDETVCRDYLIVLFDDGSCVRLDKQGAREKLQFEMYRDTADNRSGYYYIEVKIAKLISNRNSILVISLGQDLTLRLNANVFVSNSCTSFRMTRNYLIYTTTDNSIHYVLLENIQDGETVAPDKSLSQNIEDGGSLVIASESESKVVLQMPRGNLETFNPRVLILSSVTKLLIDQKYVDAIRLARRHRLNTNFLFDYLLRLVDNPESINEFANNIATADPTLLNLLLSELEETDTISGRYREIMRHLPLGRGAPSERLLFRSDKVNQICKSITLPPTVHYLQPKLLTLLKRKPMAVGEALSIVIELDRGSQQNAIKFILYFMDIDQLFLEALSTYRTDITLMVASASNKDPKEYLHLLSEFNKIENKLERCYAIDVYSKNYDKALDHAVELLQKANCSWNHPAILRIVDLVTSKRLYKKAVLSLANLYDKIPPVVTAFCQIWVNYGNYLFEKRHYSEAATAYSKAYYYREDPDTLNKAMNSYQLAGEWKRSIALVARSSIDDANKRIFYEGISDQLLERGKHYEAALLTTLSESRVPSKLVERMLDKNDWFLAEALSDSTDQLFMKSLVKSVTDHLSGCCKTWEFDLKTAETQFSRLKQLLVDYREKKKSDNLDFDQQLSDSSSTLDSSEASSELTVNGFRRPRSGASSIKTRNTSKSGKPQQAKRMRIDLKTGSRNEDIALILELKKYITQQRSNQSDAIELCAAQYEYRDFNSARESVETVNKLLTQGFKFSREISETLWPLSRQEEQPYSLYERFNKIFTPSDEPFENALFEVLIKPELPNLVLFEI